jgi:Domain of unknown function (DUF397)
MGTPEDFSQATWRKSSWSGGNGGQCVEVAVLGGGSVGVRDSKDGGRGPILIFTSREWNAFIGVAADGECNRT